MNEIVNYQKILVKIVSENTGDITYKPLKIRTPDGEEKFIVTDKIVSTSVSEQEIINVLKSKIYTRFFRVFLLHDDDSIKEEITNQVINTGTLEKTYQQGQTRSISLTIMNPTNIWNPSPTSGKLWANTKFKLQMGLYIGDYVYLIDEGIFVVQDPNLSNEDSNKVVSLQLYDKFALLDGTINGNIDTDYQIPLGTNLYEAARSLLSLPKDNLGRPYDSQTINFPVKFMNVKTPYTIKKTSSNSIGEILIELATIISCDIYYDGNGHLTFYDVLDDLDYHKRRSMWIYQENANEFFRVSRKDEWSKIRNKYVIKGTNINGRLCKAIVENTNMKSPFNVYSNFGVKMEIIENSLLNTDNLCLENGKYELRKNSMRYISINFNSIFIPHLAPNDLVRWTYTPYGFLNKNFIVQSVSIPLNAKELMSVSITNVEDLPF
jgi:hypothetical protein